MGNNTSSSKTLDELDVSDSNYSPSKYDDVVHSAKILSKKHPTPSPSFSRGGGHSNKRGQMLSSTINQRITESKCISMTILKDSSTQTEIVSVQKYRQLFSIKKMIIYSFMVYIALCLLISLSSSLQAPLIYLNLLRSYGSQKELQNLPALGLSHGRNIAVKTEDGYTLYGYHIMPLHKFKEISADIEGRPLSVNQNKTAATDDAFNYHLANADRVIVFFHGAAFTRAKWYRIELIKQLSNLLDAHVVAFDYRGFGDSEGWPSEFGIHIDSRSMMSWLFNEIIRKHNIQYHHHNQMGHKPFHQQSTADGGEPSSNPRPHSCIETKSCKLPKIYVYGQSLGTAISTEMVMEINRNQYANLLAGPALYVDGLILDSPFSSLAEATRTFPIGAIFRIFPFIQRFMESNLRIKYPTIDRISHVHTPLLIVHGLKDFKVPIDNSARLLKAALSSRKFYEFDYTANRPSQKFTNMLLNSSHSHDKYAYPIGFQPIPEAGHVNSYQYQEWLHSVSSFFRFVESS